ncbi:MAG: hydroxymethylbilane synthase [Propionibacteriales bacterium]|nr:hydroxymethylbilane synthase [Propionibacteriales bacterium]
MTVLRIGTRRSTLARAQSEAVADRLRRVLGVTVELVPVLSDGDKNDAPLVEIGGQGVFVGAVRDRLAAGQVDLVVHSLKDLPTADDDRVILAAVPRRGDPRDALVARAGLTLGELPAGSTVGTGSPRRAAQLRALGLGVEVVEIRGNVDTRLAKVASGALDAVLLARAGLVRLGREDEITENLDPIQMLPAPGQGALAVEVAATAAALGDDLRTALDDPDSRAAVTAERSLLRTLQAGCLAPIGALADVGEGDDGPEMYLRAVVAAVDGSHLVRLSAAGEPEQADALGRMLAADLLAEGAGDLMQERAS